MWLSEKLLKIYILVYIFLPEMTVIHYSSHEHNFIQRRIFIRTHFYQRSSTSILVTLLSTAKLGDNTFGSVCPSIRLSLDALLFEPFDLLH